MRKSLLMLVLIGWSALFAGDHASAQGIYGRWRSVGNAAGGARYVSIAIFAGNGGLQYQMAVAAGPGQTGSGITYCRGSYRFNGYALATSARCSNGMTLQSSTRTRSPSAETFSAACNAQAARRLRVPSSRVA
jgi:hypothetical protein